MLLPAKVLSRPCLSRVNTSRAAYAAATAEIPPTPAGTTQGSQLTLRANSGREQVQQ
jgi:hypothetical protein